MESGVGDGGGSDRGFVRGGALCPRRRGRHLRGPESHVPKLLCAKAFKMDDVIFRGRE